MCRIKPPVYVSIQDPADSVGTFMVEVGTAVAEAAVAEEASVHAPVDPGCSRESGVLYHLPVNL